MRGKLILLSFLLLFIINPVSADLVGIPRDWGHTEVNNWNFETWSSGPSAAPSGWTFTTTTGFSSYGRSSDSVISDYSFYLQTNGASPNAGDVYQNVNLAATTYKMSGWFKVEGMTSGRYILMIPSMGSSAIILNADNSGDGWEYHEVTFTVSSPVSTKLSIFADSNPNNGAKVYIDGVTFYESGNANLDSNKINYNFNENLLNVTINYTPSGSYSPSILTGSLSDGLTIFFSLGEFGPITAVYTTDDINYYPVSVYRVDMQTSSAKEQFYADVSAWPSGVTRYLIISIPVNMPPDIIYPLNGSSIASAYPDYNTVPLQWDNVADHYYIAVSKYPNFSSTWYESTVYNSHYNVTLDSGVWYWKITGYNDAISRNSTTTYGYFEIGAGVPESGYIRIYVKDELTGLNISSFTVDLFNSTSYMTKNATSGYVEFSSSEVISGEYKSRIYSSGYSPRYRIITSPETITAVLAGENNTALISFSEIDYSGYFEFSDTRLIVSKPSSSGELLISDSYFDASGSNSVYLVSGTEYNLRILSSTAQKDLSPYVATDTAAVSLVVGDISLVPESSNFGGFNYTISKTNSSVTFSWYAPAGCLVDPIQYTITDSNNTVVLSSVSVAPVGTATYIYGNPDEQYKITLYVNTTGGILRHVQYVRGEEQPIDLQISDKWYNLISVFGILVLGLIFSYRSASIGALITSIVVAGLYIIGLLKISGLIVSLIVVIGLLAVFRGRTG